ncbi:MAG: class I SAM-dependent methyltransferase [Polyangiaceae bacterium]
MNAPPLDAARPSNPAAAFYDEVWEQWGALDDHSPAAFHRRRLLVSLIREHARSCRQVLEVGSGQGVLLRQLAREFPAALVHGSDVSAGALDRTRAHCPQAPLFQLDLDSPYFEEHAEPHLGRFDLVVCSEVLEHLRDDRRALGRLRALLAPNGTLLLSVPSGERTRFDCAIGHLRHYTPSELAAKLGDVGLRADAVFSWGFPFHSFYRWVVKWAARAALTNLGSPRGSSSPNAWLSGGYAAFSAALKPLYYLNRSGGGPQLFAVARREA